MAEIIVDQISKRFNHQLIIDNFSFHFESGKNYAIRGLNGSGKSTLVSMLIGFLTPSKGSILYRHEGKNIKRGDIFKYLSIASPYSSMIEDFTLEENLNFLKKFKTLQHHIEMDDVYELLEWNDQRGKLFRTFSSGMKQKANVLFSFLSSSPLLFLDEPTSYMDIKAKEWYLRMFEKYTNGRTIIVASNDESDFINIHKEVFLGK
jgi:ABC-type multidrug transport system ATPase subunit